MISRFQFAILPLQRPIVAACIALGAASLLADDVVGPTDQLIAELASDDFSVRQRATAQLQQAGQDVIPQIVAALRSPDSEIRNRSWSILLAHALSPRGDIRDSARVAIKQLRDQTSGEHSAAIQGGLNRVREAIASQAATELAKLGALTMPLQGGPASTYNVQLGESWRGGDEKLALLSDLGSIPWLSLENARVTDAALPHLARLSEPYPGVTKLYLGASGITGIALQTLAPLKRLQYLSLKHLPIDDARLARLPDLPDLQYLGLDGTQIRDNGLKHLIQYSRLQVLWLDNTRVTDAGLVHLTKLPNLDTLYMPGTDAGGPGLAELRYAPKLKSISLKGVKFAPDGLRCLAQIEQLESLGLDMTNVTDDQLADLASLKQLRILWLSGTKVGDDGIEHLKSLRSLQIVHLSNTLVSREGAAELERALPRCQITIEHSARTEIPGRNQPPRAAPRPPAP